MSQISPTTAMLWSILSIMYLAFMLHHMYRSDRFQCPHWPSREPANFKRVLTYGYMLSIPLLVVFSVGNAVLKYRYGYTQLPNGAIIPTPLTMWSERSKAAGRAFYTLLAIAWSLEIVSHLEEWTFWLFLLSPTVQARQWIHSPHFLSWCIGSGLAIIGMPLVAGLAGDLAHAEAYVLLAGSVGSGIITVASLQVIWLFPKFIRRIRSDGAEPDVVGRLSKYSELNNIRVLFRFLFFVPFLVLGVHALKTVNTDDGLGRWGAWIDALAILGSIAVLVSSAITLLVFFPRRSTTEVALAHNAHALMNNYYTHSPPPNLALPHYYTTTHSRPESLVSSFHNRRTPRTRGTNSRTSNSIHTIIDFPAPTATASLIQKGFVPPLHDEFDDHFSNPMQPESFYSLRQHLSRDSSGLPPRDSWTSRNMSTTSFEYEVTVERYDDKGKPMALREVKVGVEDVPFDAMRAAGRRYEEVQRELEAVVALAAKLEEEAKEEEERDALDLGWSGAGKTPSSESIMAKLNS